MMRAYVAAAALALLVASGCRQGTYLRVTVEAAPSLRATALEVTVGNGGRSSDGRVAKDGAAFAFPQTFYVSFDEGRSGAVTVEVLARDGATEVARAKADAVLVPGNTVEQTVTLTSPAIPDMATPDLTPRPPVSFAPPRSYPTGDGPLTLTIGDVDADGKPDLVVGCEVGNVLSILLNNGDGTLSQNVDYPVGGLQPDQPRIADFDGDGQADIFVALGHSDAVAFLYGVGRGRLGAPSVLPMNQRAFPVSTLVVDLNNDGRWDAVTNDMSPGVNGVTAYLNLGGRKFMQIPGPGVGGRRLAAKDFDFDGRVDILGSGAGLTLGSFREDNTFGSAVHFPGPQVSGGDLIVGRWTGDASYDVIQASAGVYLYPGEARGQFKEPRKIAEKGNGSAVGGDFDGDSRLDVVFTVFGEGVYLLRSLDGGTFADPVLLFAARYGPDITIGDLNADGRPDIALAGGDPNVATVLMNTTP